MRRLPPDGFHSAEITFPPDVWELMEEETTRLYKRDGTVPKPSVIVNKCIREVLGKQSFRESRRPVTMAPSVPVRKTGSGR